MKAKIIFYKQDKLDQNTKFKLRRDLLGIKQKSNFSQYDYKINGILDKIPSYRPIDSTIIVENKDLTKIKTVLKRYNAYYEVFNTEISSDKLRIKSMLIYCLSRENGKIVEKREFIFY